MTAKRNKQSASHNGSDGSSSGCPQILYTPSPGTTSDVEVQTLAAVYAFVLQCGETKEAAGKVGRDENVPEPGHVGEQPKEGHAEHAQEAEVFKKEVLDNDY